MHTDFILLWQYQRPIAFDHMPRHACVMPNPTGGLCVVAFIEWEH